MCYLQENVHPRFISAQHDPHLPDYPDICSLAQLYVLFVKERKKERKKNEALKFLFLLQLPVNGWRHYFTVKSQD
jgi:hypothetical protein